MNDHFKDLVHVHTRTWLGLMGVMNLMYFAMGIVTFATSTESSYVLNETVPTYLSWIYMSCCIAFVALSLLIAVKMENIFSAIIQKDVFVKLVEKSVRSLNSVTDGDDDVSFADFPKQHHVDQEDLFWFRRPDLIITFAQMMNFL